MSRGALWLLLLLAVAGCRASEPPPASRPVPSAMPTRAIPSAVPSEAALPPRATRPVATASPTSLAPASALRLGGLEEPATVPWFAAAPQGALAPLLAGLLNRSLLAAAGERPGLADSWQMDGARARFTLGATARWSDGSPLRAADVADLLLRAAAEGDLAGLQGARALDERTVELTLTTPHCPALLRAATFPLVDLAEWPPTRTSSGVQVRPLDEGWDFAPLGTRYQPFETEQALRAAWAAGEIDGVVGASRLREGPLAGPWQASQQDGPLLATLLFRQGDARLADGRLREALTLATDRAALYEAAYGSAPDALLTALLPPGHWAAPAPTALPAPDSAAAAALLARAGWQDRDGDGLRENEAGEPLRLTLTLPLSDDHRWEALAHALVAQWAAVGIALEPIFMEPYGLQERLHIGRWQVALLAYTVGADPDQRALWAVPAPDDVLGQDLNISGANNPAVAELMAQGAELPGCAPTDRAPFYQQAWSLLLQDRPLWPLFPLPLDLLYRPGAPLLGGP